MYIARVPSNSFVQINSYVGQRWPAYTSAAGKALLAFLPEAQMQRLLKEMVFQKRTPYTLTSKSSLVKQLRTFRQLGYTWERNEGEIGLGCVAAPIVGAGQEVVATISLTGTTHQVSVKRVPKLGALVKKYAEQISRRLGGDVIPR